MATNSYSDMASGVCIEQVASLLPAVVFELIFSTSVNSPVGIGRGAPSALSLLQLESVLLRPPGVAED